MDDMLLEKQKRPRGTYENPIVLSSMSRDEAVLDILKTHPEANREILERQKIIDVTYLNKDGKVCRGQIVVDEALVKDIVALFAFIKELNENAKNDREKFYIEKIIPIAKYGWNDERSIEDNNTSGFNYRTIAGTNRLSLHAFGFAIDINPLDNPVMEDGVVTQVAGGKYDENDPNTLTSTHKVVRFLVDRLHFDWGGDWISFKDYQHFEKVLPTTEYIEYYLVNVITDPKITHADITKRLKKLIQNSVSVGDFKRLLAFIREKSVIDKIGSDNHIKFLKILNKKIKAIE